nr:hypothetical protein [Leptospira interrogans]
MTFFENPNIYAKWVSYPKQIQRLLENIKEISLVALKNKGVITIQYLNGITKDALYRGHVSEYDYNREAWRAELYLRVILENNDTDTLILDVSEIICIKDKTKPEIILKFQKVFSNS